MAPISSRRALPLEGWQPLWSHSSYPSTRPLVSSPWNSKTHTHTLSFLFRSIEQVSNSSPMASSHSDSPPKFDTDWLDSPSVPCMGPPCQQRRPARCTFVLSPDSRFLLSLLRFMAYQSHPSPSLSVQSLLSILSAQKPSVLTHSPSSSLILSPIGLSTAF